MQKWTAIAGMLLMAILVPRVGAKAVEHASGFGFGISVPDGWLVLTRGEVTSQAELFLDESASSGLSSIPAAMRRVVYERVQAGEVEIFYRLDSEPGSFVDNVNVLVQAADLPATFEQLTQICQLLPGEFSRVFQRPIAMDLCEMRKRVRRALYLQFDGAIPGTTTIQYQIQRAPGEALVITATTATDNLPRMMGEFEEMIASIRLH